MLQALWRIWIGRVGQARSRYTKDQHACDVKSATSLHSANFVSCDRSIAEQLSHLYLSPRPKTTPNLRVLSSSILLQHLQISLSTLVPHPHYCKPWLPNCAPRLSASLASQCVSVLRSLELVDEALQSSTTSKQPIPGYFRFGQITSTSESSRP